MPPDTVRVISPSVSPKQSRSSPVADALSKVGSVISALAVAVQPLASVSYTHLTLPTIYSV